MGTALEKARIAIVDDDVGVARACTALLIELGYDVVGRALNASDALTLVATSRPDLVLLDVDLRDDVSGIRVAELLQERHNPRPAIVYVTGHGDSATVSAASATQVEGYLLKPYSDAQVQATIEIALARHRAEQRIVAMERAHAEASEQLRDTLVTSLHDDVGQPLVGVALLCRSLRADVDAPAMRKLDQIEELLARSMERIAAMLRDASFHPTVGATLPEKLVELVEELRTVSAVTVDLRCDGDAEDITSMRAAQLCEIAREAVTRAVRTCGATRVRVTLASQGRTTSLEIIDDGDDALARARADDELRMIEYRSRLCGVAFASGPSPPRGTRITCSWEPVPPRA